MSKKYFRWLGGKPIFDFCNTIMIHPESKRELIENVEDLQRWFAHIGHEDLDITPDILEAMIELRGELRAAFLVLLEDEDRGVNLLNQILEKHQTRLKIQPSHKNYQIQYFTDQAPKGIILSELVKIFENINLSRIKICYNERCSHFFYDTSKANRRKWCDMDSCGNKMKAKRFYARQKEAQNFEVC